MDAVTKSVEEMENSLLDSYQGLLSLYLAQLEALTGNEAKRHQLNKRSRKKKVRQIRKDILKLMQEMMDSGLAMGFWFGIVDEDGGTMSGVSSNLQEWWEKEMRFDETAPAAIAEYNRMHKAMN